MATNSNKKKKTTNKQSGEEEQQQKHVSYRSCSSWINEENKRKTYK